MEDDVVKEQLRAGSILEAVRIRKIGYGYRMSYDDFADQFWPILGGRVYEATKETIETIFQRAQEFVDDYSVATLTLGADQGW